MNGTIRHILLALLLILAQGALDNYVNLTVYLDLSLCLFIILTLPFRWGTVPTMLTAFTIGIVTDILGNGIPGMSAAAMTAAGLCRRSLLLASASAEKDKQTIDSLGVRRFVLYSAPIILIYMTVYILLDSSGFRPAGQCLARLGISLVANTAMMAFLYTLSTENHSRRK